MSKKEIRMFSAPVKVETRDDGTIGSIVGYPIVYNKDSEDMGFTERISPGAAKEALKRSNVRGLKNHDENLIFARQGVNLTLKEDKDGVRYEATPVNTQNFREVAEEVQAGLLTGQSFAFTIQDDEWADVDTDHPTRTITKIREIFDVGPVTYPAYSDTTVALRSLEAARQAPSPSEEVVVRIHIHGVEGDIEFSGEDCAEQVIHFVTDLRSLSQPTLPDDDGTQAGPTPPEPGGDEILDRMNSIIKKYDTED